MRTERTILSVLTGVLLSLLVGPAVGESIPLAKRYSDPLNGFSLRPPEQTQRQRKPSPSLLVSWVKRDVGTGAIAWTLSVQRAVDRQKKIDLKPYGQALAEKLRREEKFKVESVDVVPVAGKGAIHLRGQFTVIVKLWQRQVWILAEPGRFLILTVTGQIPDKEKLNSLCDAVLATLQLIDPKKEFAERKARVERGEKLLASLNNKKVTAVLDAQSRWYLFRLKDDYVGFMKVSEKAARRNNSVGVEISKWIMFKFPEDDARLMKRTLFAAGGASVEIWSEHLQVGEGDRSVWRVEKGIRQDELIVCTVSECGRERVRKKGVPQKIYLARATGDLLPRLVDLKKPQSYAFARYTSESNAFEMRTFAVVGPEKITVGGRRVDAIRATDQSSPTADAASLWLDAEGRLLRMQTEQDLSVQRSTRAAVLRRFANAERLILELDKFAQAQ